MPAVAVLVVVLLALMAALLAYAAAQLLRPLLVAGLGQLPLVGGWIQSNEAGLLGSVILAINSWAGSALSPLADLVQRLDQVPRILLAALDPVLVRAYSLLQALVLVRLPALEARAHAHAQQLTDGLRGDVSGRFNADEAQSAAAISGLRADVGGALNALRADVSGRFTVDEATTATAISGLRADVGGALNAEHDFARGVELEALRGIEAGVRTAEALAQQEAQAAQAAGEAAAQAARDFAGQVGLESRGYTDQRSGALASALAAGLAASAVAVKALEDSACMQRCDTLGDLGAAIEAIDLGAILGLIALAASDGPAATRLLRETMVPVVEGATAAAEGLVGLAR